MRSVVSVFATTWLLATTVSAQNRVEFGGLSAWELTQGVAVQTTCEVKLIDEVMGEVYCFSSAAAKASFARDLEGNIVKALAAYEHLRPHAAGERSFPGADQLSPQVRALATHPPTPAGCTHFTSGVAYPGNGYYFYCGANPALYRNVGISAAGSIPPHLRTTLQNGNVYIYVFRDAAQYDSVFGRGVAGINRLYGNTAAGQQSGTNVIVNHSAVFENVRGVGAVSQPDIGTAIKHELGHALDLTWGVASAKPKYTGLLASDWTTLNSFSRSILFPNGLPKSYHASVTNEQIVKDLWPHVFKPDPVKGYAELYAWEFCAQASCNPDIVNPYYPQTSLRNLLIPTSKFPRTRNYFKDLWYNRGTPF